MADGSGTTAPAAPVSAGTAEVGNPWRKGWRSAVLLGMTAALVLLGFVFWQASAVGEENASLQADTPQLMGVFCTDPNATIHLTTDVFWHNAGNFPFPLEEVYVSATAPDAPKNPPTVLIASSLQPVILISPDIQATPDNFTGAITEPDTRYHRAVFYSGSKPFSALGPPEYISEMPLNTIQLIGPSDIGPGIRTEYGNWVGTFELPQITQESHGSFFAHLPQIGIGTGSFNPLPYLISESSSSQQEQLIEGPQLKSPNSSLEYPGEPYGSSDPAAYQAPPGQHLKTAYWQPASLTTTEILEDVKSEMEDSTINGIVPDGSLQGDNFVWQGGYSLEPTMSLTNQDAAASHGDWVFFSGIAFGIAAGSGVGFIQQDPNFFSLLGRRQRATNTPRSTRQARRPDLSNQPYRCAVALPDRARAIRSVDCVMRTYSLPILMLTCLNRIHRCAVGGSVERSCAVKMRPGQPGGLSAEDHWYSSKKPGLTATTSLTCSRTSTPRRNSLSRSHSLSPSISSTGGAPSRVASP